MDGLYLGDAKEGLLKTSLLAVVSGRAALLNVLSSEAILTRLKLVTRLASDARPNEL